MPAAFALDYSSVLDALHAPILKAFGSAKSAAKELARAANCNERTAANLLAKRNLPDALHMLKLMAAVPEFAAEVRRLTGMETDLDPEFERDMSKLFVQWQRMRDRERMP